MNNTNSLGVRILTAVLGLAAVSVVVAVILVVRRSHAPVVDPVSLLPLARSDDALSSTLVDTRPETAAGVREEDFVRIELSTAAPILGNILVSVRHAKDDSPGQHIPIKFYCNDVGRESWRQFQTGLDGQLLIEGVPIGVVSVGVPHVPWARVVLAEGVTGAVDFLIPAGVDVNGLVVDRNGMPVPEADVWGVEKANRPEDAMIIARCDSKGSFTIRDAPVGAHLVGRAGGYQASMPVRLGHSASISSLILTLGEPGATVIGRVVDSEANPVPGASVFVGWNPIREIPEKGYGHRMKNSALVTDGAGRFEATGVPVDWVQPIWVWRGGYGIARVVIDAGVLSNLVIILADEARLDVEVVDQLGAPIRGAGVRYINESWQKPGMAFDGPMWAKFIWSADEEGRCELKNLPGGPGVLEISTVKPRQVVRRNLNLREGHTARWRVVVQGEENLVEAKVRVDGHVLDAGGTPIGGVEVSLVTGGTGRATQSVTTREDGSFMLNDVPVDSTVVRVTDRNSNWLPDIAPIEFSSVPSYIPVKLPYTYPLVRVTGTVPNISSQIGFLDLHRGRSSKRFETTVGEHGRFEVDLLVPGAYEAEFSIPGIGAADLGLIELVSGLDADVGLVDLESTGTLEVRTRGPITACMIKVGKNGSTRTRFARARDGVAKFWGLVPGEYVVSTADSRTTLASVVVSVAGRMVVDLETAAGISKTLKPDGPFLAGVYHLLLFHGDRLLWDLGYQHWDEEKLQSFPVGFEIGRFELLVEDLAGNRVTTDIVIEEGNSVVGIKFPQFASDAPGEGGAFQSD